MMLGHSPTQADIFRSTQPTEGRVAPDSIYGQLRIFEVALEGETLLPALGEVVTLLGQDLETDDTGTFRIARRVTAIRLISTVDPDARHGRKRAPAASTATRATSRSVPTASS